MSEPDDIAVELAQLTIEDAYCTAVNTEELRRMISLQEARYLGAAADKAIDLAGKIEEFLKSGAKPTLKAVK
jgi:hypothetical protein